MQIMASLAAIASAPLSSSRPLGALTTADRDSWASARCVLRNHCSLYRCSSTSHLLLHDFLLTVSSTNLVVITGLTPERSSLRHLSTQPRSRRSTLLSSPSLSRSLLLPTQNLCLPMCFSSSIRPLPCTLHLLEQYLTPGHHAPRPGRGAALLSPWQRSQPVVRQGPPCQTP